MLQTCDRLATLVSEVARPPEDNKSNSSVLQGLAFVAGQNQNQKNGFGPQKGQSNQKRRVGSSNENWCIKHCCVEKKIPKHLYKDTIQQPLEEEQKVETRGQSHTSSECTPAEGRRKKRKICKGAEPPRNSKLPLQSYGVRKRRRITKCSRAVGWHLLYRCKACNSLCESKTKLFTHGLESHEPTHAYKQWIKTLMYNLYTDDLFRLTYLLLLCKSATFSSIRGFTLPRLSDSISGHDYEILEQTPDHLQIWSKEESNEKRESWQTLPRILSLLPKENPIVNSEEWPESGILSLVVNTLLNEGGPVQRTSNDPQMNSKVLSIHTEWEVDSNLKLIETLIDTGCNITAVSQALIESISTRSGQRIQIGLLSKPTNLQTCSMISIKAIGKVEVSFRLGGTPMIHNFLVFAKLPYEATQPEIGCSPHNHPPSQSTVN